MPSTATLTAPSVQRVAACLTAYAVALPPDHAPFHVSQERLGAQAVLPLRTLARALSVLSDAGVIEHKRGRFRILDAPRLFQLAGGDAPRMRKANTPPATLDMPPATLDVQHNQPPAPFDSATLATLQSLTVSLRAEVSGLRAEVAVLRSKVSDNMPPATLNVPPATFDSAALVAPIVAALDSLRAEVSGLRADLLNKLPATFNVPLAANMPPATFRTASEEGSDGARGGASATETALQLQALVDREGSKAKAARLLGVDESAVRRALKGAVSPRLAAKMAALLGADASG